MTIPLPNLDNLNYADLLEEVEALIPSECPQWTDRNPSDLGIVLLELFAWLSEMLFYQVNQIPDRNYQTFLELLNEPGWKLESDLQTAIRETVLDLRRRYRAVTPEDFEALACNDWSATAAAQAMGRSGIVKRAKCFPQRNLVAESASQRQRFEPGHVSLAIVPSAPPIQNKVLSFDGTEDWVELPTPRYDTVGAIATVTIDAWVRTSSNWEIPVISWDDNQYWQLSIGNDRTGHPQKRVRWATLDESLQSQDLNGITDVADGDWHHIAVTYEAGSGRKQIYVDGRLDAETLAHDGRNLGSGVPRSGAIGRSFPGLHIVNQHRGGIEARDRHGESRSGGPPLTEEPPPPLDRVGVNTRIGSVYYDGEIAVVRLWDRALSAAEILQLTNRSPDPQEAPGLVGDWGLDLDLVQPGRIVRDRTHHNHDGLLRGAPDPIVVIPNPSPSANLRQGLWSFLDERRLLTTRHHILGPRYQPFEFQATLWLLAGANPPTVRNQAIDQLSAFFNPLTGGPKNTGWPFGRSIYLSELYQLLENLAGVDFVTDLVLQNDPTLQTVPLQQDELVALRFERDSLILKEAWEHDD